MGLQETPADFNMIKVNSVYNLDLYLLRFYN